MQIECRGMSDDGGDFTLMGILVGQSRCRKRGERGLLLGWHESPVCASDWTAMKEKVAQEADERPAGPGKLVGGVAGVGGVEGVEGVEGYDGLGMGWERGWRVGVCVAIGEKTSSRDGRGMRWEHCLLLLPVLLAEAMQVGVGEGESRGCGRGTWLRLGEEGRTPGTGLGCPAEDEGTRHPWDPSGP